MNELKNIFKQYHSLKERRTACILATVVHVEGSSYRRAGARMLVDEFGNMTGAISGGCLEGDALKKALLALHKQTTKLVTYDTSNDDDAAVGAQLGCNGIIKVLFEPINYEDNNNAVEICQWAESLEEGAFIQILYHDEEECKGTINAFSLKKGWMVPPMSENGHSSSFDNNPQHSFYKSDNHTGEIYFFNFIRPKTHLIIVGAGNDAILLHQFALLLGWNITILDGRHTHLTKERFDENCQIYLGNAEEVRNCVKVPKCTAAVLMSHNFQYDLKALSQLLKVEQLAYIGILGPKKKYQKMLDQMEVNGEDIASITHIYAPMGFDIGAETPSEIALSVLAEIQSVMNGKNGASLKFKEGRIHED